jgi:hypothetical protein
VSKAILRAALDEFLRRHEDLLNKELYYFPAYEIVTQYFVDPFREDNRHLAPFVPGRIIAFFVRHFCRAELAQRADPEALAALPSGKMLDRVMRHAAIVGDEANRELLVRIAELEQDMRELQRAADERLGVIDELKRAADERLRLVEELHRTAAERLEIIEQMRATEAKP